MVNMEEIALSGWPLFVFLAVYTLILILFGCIGYSIKQDIRYVIVMQIISASVVVLFLEIVLRFIGMVT